MGGPAVLGQHLLVLSLCAEFLPGLHLPPGCCTPRLCLRRVPEPWHLERKGAPLSPGPEPDGLGV